MASLTTNLWRGLLNGGRLASRDARRRWYLVIPLAIVWILAYVRVFGEHRPIVPLLFNVTPSMPYSVAWLDRGAPVAKGDYVLYAFHGSAEKQYPGLSGQPFFKMIAGTAGDRVRAVGRDLYVNDVFVGQAKERLFDGRPVHPLSEQVIPSGYLYVRGTAPDSFDSRYRESGLVATSDVIGKVIPWF